MDWEGEVNDREDLLIVRMWQLDEWSLEIARAGRDCLEGALECRYTVGLDDVGVQSSAFLTCSASSIT